MPFQSRNRDAFHFKQPPSREAMIMQTFVSISESRCFSFQGDGCDLLLCPFVEVSISESRCFSFQGSCRSTHQRITALFQSRNRDAFHFKSSVNCIPTHPQSRFQSRNRDAFHFKGNGLRIRPVRIYRFNLGIEMLFISSYRIGIGVCSAYLFQSRNRDAFHFKIKESRWHGIASLGFNLGIEMLFISRIQANLHTSTLF